MVLNRMIGCLTRFKVPSDRVKAGGATHPAKTVGQSMLMDLSTADTTLSKHAEAARAAASGHSSLDHARASGSSEYWEAHRSDLFDARSTLLAWLGEDAQQKEVRAA